MGGPPRLTLQRLDLDSVDWDRLDSFDDRLVFQTQDWLRFVADSQGAEPVVASLRGGGEGYFTGLVIRRLAVGVLGSPLPGWTTSHMGFNLESGVSRRAAVEALLEFAFDDLGVAHVELRDRLLTVSEVDGLGFQQTPWNGLEVDLTEPEDEIMARMKGPCRTAIRKAAREGVRVEEADDLGFADDFHSQLTEVFARQSLVPPYGPERIRTLIRDVHPSGRLLLLRARDPGGECIATGIFPAHNRTMHFLAGASHRRYQGLRPNEAVMWHAMRYWKARGVEVCDLGGLVAYKRKWGAADVHVPFLRRSRSRRVAALRTAAQAAYGARRRAAGIVAGRRRTGVDPSDSRG